MELSPTNGASCAVRPAFIGVAANEKADLKRGNDKSCLLKPQVPRIKVQPLVRKLRNPIPNPGWISATIQNGVNLYDIYFYMIVDGEGESF